jgi:uncharacterized protein YjiS (DUF1127 family)
MSSSTLHETRLALSPLPRAAPRRSRWMIEALREIGIWLALNRERHALAELDPRLLDDIGVPQDAAAREAAKPFWRR